MQCEKPKVIFNANIFVGTVSHFTWFRVSVVLGMLPLLCETICQAEPVED